MRKWALVVLGLASVVALARAGNDPWKGKPYQQWTAKDIQRVITDSPWAKVVHVDAPWKSGGGKVAEAKSGAGGGPEHSGGNMGRGGGTGSSGDSTYGGGSSTNPQLGSQGAGGGDAEPQGTPSAAFVIRWASARTFREALARDAILAGKMKPEEADAEVAKDLNVYQVVVAGPDMTPFNSLDEAALKAAASLTTKRSKQKISPSAVLIEREPDGKSVAGLVYSFPVKEANGETSIGSDEKGVEFALFFGKLNIKTSFDISKMADSKGRDL